MISEVAMCAWAVILNCHSEAVLGRRTSGDRFRTELRCRGFQRDCRREAV